MKELTSEFRAYTWAPPSDEVARLAGIDPSQVVRFDQNTPPLPLPTTRPGTIARALASISGYPPGGYHELKDAIASYNGLGPENVVLGVGADDLILLIARCYAGPGDTIAIPEPPTYPLYRIAAQLARAEVGDDDPVLTFTCRPNNPDGVVRPLPEARPLVVDEAYFEYFGETAIPLLDDGVIVLRTFSKAFALAGARIGYALAAPDVAEELNARQAPAPVSTVSAALAVAALASPPDMQPAIEERERFASALRAIGLPPLPSRANFLFVPVEDGRALGERLLHQGFVVRVYADGIRMTVRDRVDDDLVVEALARLLDRPSPVAEGAGRRVRHLRATAETRISVRLGLDGASRVSVQTGGGLYDHFLEQLAFHAGLDLTVEGSGDLETGDHHTVEDTALAFGEALDLALGDRRGIARYGDAVVPMDDALARAAVDLGGRPFAELSIEPEPGMAGHFFGSLAQAARMAIHVEATGRDAHHTAEAAYKAVGRALRTALRVESSGIPSTKGQL
ncbi:MAG TPA: aminotransferase class I/II-fold pyridoxal phosphate-dependent enzyme [Gaiellaceae bacterium]|jgi:histidinol-phosphate/aromatic aminotransferase/cobyric acid decarboxylase-like protein/imidazoleglycerol phosphate dehydratase HisB|nr:aminotransferase class I/II-fold pyridoxal phosphate-dependent enzyme [Gaiellaceae bacterium]